MSTVPEELSIRELLVSLLGEKGRRILENRTKSNDQLFSDYLELISTTHAASSRYEAKRLLMHFKDFLGEFPPSTELGVKFLSQFQDRKAKPEVSTQPSSDWQLDGDGRVLITGSWRHSATWLWVLLIAAVIYLACLLLFGVPLLLMSLGFCLPLVITNDSMQMVTKGGTKG